MRWAHLRRDRDWKALFLGLALSSVLAVPAAFVPLFGQLGSVFAGGAAAGAVAGTVRRGAPLGGVVGLLGGYVAAVLGSLYFVAASHHYPPQPLTTAHAMDIALSAFVFGFAVLLGIVGILGAAAGGFVRSAVG